MIGKSKEKKDWNKPFVLVATSAKFQKIKSDTEGQESILTKKKNKETEEIIICPKIETLKQTDHPNPVLS